MRLVSAIWWPSDHESWAEATTPEGLAEHAADRQEAVTDGRLDLEFVDVEIGDVKEVAPWLSLIDIPPGPEAEHFLHAALTMRSSVTFADWPDGGPPRTSVILPFNGFRAEERRVAYSVRRLCVIVTRSALIRLWRTVEVVGDQRLAVDPSYTGNVGSGMPTADPERGGPFPSVFRRQRDVPPDEALIDELQAACRGGQRTATEVGDAALSWHGRFYGRRAQVGEPDEPDHAELPELGQAAHMALRDYRRLVLLAERADRRVRGMDKLPADAAFGAREGLAPQVAQARAALRETGAQLAEARQELRDAAGLALLIAQQDETNRATSFERRVSIFAGVVTGPAVIVGIAGANVDFWPLPSDGGTLAPGSLIVLLALVAITAVTAFLYLRRD